MFPNSKMSREARSQLFSFVGCLILRNMPWAFNLICLTGKGNRKQGEEMVRCSSSSHHLAPRGRGGGGKLQWELLTLPLLCFHC